MTRRSRRAAGSSSSSTARTSPDRRGGRAVGRAGQRACSSASRGRRPRPSPSTCGAPGSTCFVHHSAVSREERQLAEEQFHHGSRRLHRLHLDAGTRDRRRRSRPGPAGRGAGHGQLVPAAHGPHRARDGPGRQHHVLLRDDRGRAAGHRPDRAGQVRLGRAGRA